VGNTLPLMVGYKSAPGMTGATPYYYGIPKNPMNDWVIKTYAERYHEPPDFNTPVAMAAAIALINAIHTTNSLDTEKLIGALEGMKLDTPKGEMIIRKEDHQALQAMYVFKIKAEANVVWGIPELMREIPLTDIAVPIEVGK
jgi:branched-chain amino acid transport system substrate-binding protein